MRLMPEDLSEQPLIKSRLEAPRLALSLRAATVCLAVSTALVAGLGIIGSISRVGFGIQHGPINVISLLDFNAEATLPAWFSSGLLFLAAMLLGLIGWIKSAPGEIFRRHWLVLAALFLLLSIDEGIAIHERAAWPIERIFKLQGVFRYGWVIPAIVLVVSVGVAYLKFLLHLPAKTRRRFLLSATIYLFGALVLEMIEGAYDSRFGNQTAFYATMVAAEEIMEMAGIALFVHTLLDYLRARYGQVNVMMLVAHPLSASAASIAAPMLITTRADFGPPDRAARPQKVPAGHLSA